MYRSGPRIHEALALGESDLDQRRGSLLVRRGKGGRRREVGMDEWAWEQLQPWLDLRLELPIGPLFCVITEVHTRSAAYDSAVSSSVTVRPARVEDVEQIAHVNVRCWQETYRG